METKLSLEKKVIDFLIKDVIKKENGYTRLCFCLDGSEENLETVSYVGEFSIVGLEGKSLDPLMEEAMGQFASCILAKIDSVFKVDNYPAYFVQNIHKGTYVKRCLPIRCTNISILTEHYNCTEDPVSRVRISMYISFSKEIINPNNLEEFYSIDFLSPESLESFCSKIEEFCNNTICGSGTVGKYRLTPISMCSDISNENLEEIKISVCVQESVAKKHIDNHPMLFYRMINMAKLDLLNKIKKFFGKDNINGIVFCERVKVEYCEEGHTVDQDYIQPEGLGDIAYLLSDEDEGNEKRRGFLFSIRFAKDLR